MSELWIGSRYPIQKVLKVFDREQGKFSNAHKDFPTLIKIFPRP